MVRQHSLEVMHEFRGNGVEDVDWSYIENLSLAGV
jgi:hypothetical protein